MIPSGIAPLDQALGGLVPARIYLLTGGLGSGKTAASLQFVAASLRAGEPAAMVTADRGSDLKALAVYLGIDIETPLRAGLLQLIRYHPRFDAALANTRTPEAALADLRKMIGTNPPTRIAIDPLDPFLGDGGPVHAGSLALLDFLEGLGATALLTHFEDVSAPADRRIDPIIARSAATIRLERARGGTHCLRVLRSRVSEAADETVPFEIHRDAGIRRIAGRSGDTEPAPELAHIPRNLLVLHTSAAPASEVTDLLGRDYAVVARPAPGSDDPLEVDGDSFDGIVLSVTHDTVPAAIPLLERLNEHPDVSPIVVAARFNLRSSDRARALRAGADEVLATDMSPHEFLQRLAVALNRPHTRAARVRPAYSEVVIVQARGGFAPRPLTRDEFASALATHVARDNPVQYTVVTFAPTEVKAGADPVVTLRHVADVVMRASRMRGGDLTALVEDCVAIYLHGAQQDHAAAFADRVRRVWSGRRQPPLRIETFPYPSGEPILRTMFELSAS